MDRFTFEPIIDLPLVVITCGLFIWHFNGWARRGNLQTEIDVASRLQSARLRVFTLFTSLLLFCWILDFAVWPIFAILFGIGLVTAIFLGGGVDGAFGLWAAGYLIREWSFGFPQLILHPTKRDEATMDDDAMNDDAKHGLVGSVGITSSTLRPTGNAIIDHTSVSVVSDDGSMIDAGAEVIVASYRNGQLFVRPHLGTEDGV